MNGLDLFSGIGGLSLALSPWVRPIAYCEIDGYAQAVLLSRMQDGHISAAPIWDDVTTLLPSMLPRDAIDIIYGGFPCQDISSAGRGEGLEGKRSGLFFEIMRLAGEIRPAFLFLENVPAIRTRGLGAVVYALADLGYDCRWQMLSASEIGAPHKRNRWFCLAHAKRMQLRNKQRRSCRQSRQGTSIFGDYGGAEFMANAPESRLSRAHGQGSSTQAQKPQLAGPNPWLIEPNVGRVVNGLPFRRDRIKALGNAVVPQQAREAFKILMGLQRLYDRP